MSLDVNKYTYPEREINRDREEAERVGLFNIHTFLYILRIAYKSMKSNTQLYSRGRRALQVGVCVP